MQQRLGHYVIRGEIARGGMGVVYRAYDPELRREVAIKSLEVDRRMLGEDVERFKREVQILAGFRHPNVVRIHAVGLHEGCPYFVQDLVEGESLSAKIDARGPLPLAEAAQVIQRLAEALQAAHEQGILHRDLKPANVLLSESGEPILIDFGLAKDMSLSLSRTGLTKTGHGIGTPGYWSPEQVCGEKDKIGPRSDVYGLGATLYALLVGTPPFEGAGFVGNAALTVAQPATPPSSLRAEIDPSLEAICLKCLEKESEDRYDSAKDLAEDLARYLKGEPVLARRKPSAAARRRLLLVAAGVGLLVTLCGLLLALAPSLELESPISDLATGGKVRVSGEVTGAGPVLGVEVNGEAVDVVGGRFEVELELPEGRHEVVVAAVGLLRRTEIHRAVWVDRTTPVLSLTAPGELEIVDEGVVTLSGKIQDASRVEVAVRGGESTSVAAGEPLRLKTPLRVGLNELEITCRDAAGNEASVTLLRLLRPPSDHDTTKLLGQFRVRGQPDHYRITQLVEIPSGSSVVLPAGSRLEFSAEAGLICRGELWCRGRHGSPVVLTTSGTDPTWSGVRILGPGALGVLAWAELSKAAPALMSDAFASGSTEKTNGGALTVLGGGSLFFFDSLIRDCDARRGFGGGLRVEGEASAVSSVECVRVRFEGNSAKWGGGAFFGAHSSVRLLDCIFEGNSATNRGGGLATAPAKPGEAGGLSLRGVRFLENTSQRSGGGAMIYRTASLVDCAFEDNTAQRAAGGLGALGRLNLELTRVTFDRNESGQRGGGALIHLTHASARLRDCAFTRNRTGLGVEGRPQGSGGGGLLLIGPGEFELERARFVGNEANEGAGLAIQGDSKVLVSSCAFESNKASFAGGGFFLHPEQAELRIRGSVFSQNAALKGGAGWASAGGELSLECEDSEFLGNSAQDMGGGIGMGGAVRGKKHRLSLVGCRFGSNTSKRGSDLFVGRATSFDERQVELCGIPPDRAVRQ